MKSQLCTVGKLLEKGSVRLEDSTHDLPAHEGRKGSSICPGKSDVTSIGLQLETYFQICIL